MACVHVRAVVAGVTGTVLIPDHVLGVTSDDLVLHNIFLPLFAAKTILL